MTITTTNPCYRIHLSRLDGAAGSLTYEHVFFKRSGKPYTERAITRKFNKNMGWRGYFVSKVEVFSIAG
jgi:hypothetical protein